MVDVGTCEVSKPFDPHANFTFVQPLFSPPFSGPSASVKDVLFITTQRTTQIIQIHFPSFPMNTRPVSEAIARYCRSLLHSRFQFPHRSLSQTYDQQNQSTNLQYAFIQTSLNPVTSCHAFTATHANKTPIPTSNGTHRTDSLYIHVIIEHNTNLHSVLHYNNYFCNVASQISIILA